MKILRAVLTGCVVVLAAAGLIQAAVTANQTVTMTVNSICVLALTGNPSALTVTAPATGGLDPSNPTDTSTYAQYTSTVPTGQSRRLTAAWGGADAAPAGCSLKLTASSPGGNKGTSSGQVTVSATAQNIVTGIRSCATGSGGTYGAQLTYLLSVDTVDNLVSGESKTATISLTLTDAA